MATISRVPFGGYQLGNYLESPAGTQRSVISGLFPFTVRAGAVGGLGTQNPLIRMCVMTEDVGTNPQVAGTSGRYLRLWTRDAYGTVSANSFDPAGGLLPADNLGSGGTLGEPPDLCAFRGTVFMLDGTVRASPPGMCNRLRYALIGGNSNTFSTALDSITGVTPVSTTFIISSGAYRPTLSNDTIYFGAPGKFSGMIIRIGTSGVGTWTITWEYWNGTTWVALSGVSDGTTGFTAAAGNRTLTFTEPTNWIETTVNSLPTVGKLYWIRARVSAWTATTTSPTLTSYEITGPDTLTGYVTDYGGVVTDDTTDAQTQTINDMNLSPVTTAVNDAVYFGATNTWRSLLINIGTAGVGVPAGTWEYRSSAGGGSWVALSGVTDGTVTFTVAGYSMVLFTQPSDWATVAVGGLTKYWIRFRYTAVGTPSTAPLGTQAWVFSVSRSASSGAVGMYVGDDPANAAPALVPWGVPVLTNASPPIARASSTGINAKFAFYSTKTDAESALSEVLSIGGNITALDHGDSQVDAIRCYVSSGASYARAIWPDGRDYLPKGTTSNLNTSAYIALATADADVALGPTLGADADQAVSKSTGTYLSCASGRARIVCGGATQMDTSSAKQRRDYRNEIAWSALNKPHYFPAANRTSVDANDGDEIVAVRELFDKFYIFKRASIWVLTIDPSFNLSLVSAGVGAYSKRSVVKAGNVLIFHGPGGVYTIDGGGNLSKLPISAGIQRVVEGLNDNALRNSCAAWWPERLSYFLALPGLLSKLNGSGTSVPGATSGVTGATNPINDVILQCHLPTSQWSIWVGEGCFAASMTSMWATSDAMELWTGGYFGRVYRADYSKYLDGMEAAGFTYEGTITTAIPIGGSSVIDSAATFPVSGSDRRHLELFVWIPAQGEVRRVTASSATGLTVAPSWNGSYGIGTRYYLGNIYASVETGDLTFGSPFTHKALAAVRLLTNKARNAAMDLDLAVTPAGVDTVTAASYAGGTVGTAYPPNRVMMPFKPGYTLRLLAAMRMGGPATSPVEIRGLELDLTTLGRPGG